MSWSDFAVSAGLSGMKAIGSYIQQKRQYEADKSWQKYNDKLTRIQDSRNQNNITINQNMAFERQVREKYQIDQAEYKTKASAEVAAAAVGAEGNSVDKVLLEVSQNASRARSQSDIDMNYQLVGYRNQREASSLQMFMQLDRTQIPKPNLAANLLSWGADAAGKYWDSKNRT
ncbi:internal virion protein [Rhizobium phage RHEph08]|uniref:Putative internal virion protein n=3 Tax=Cuernavacavirus TaxID=2731935 RepID=L7TN49_9CAUD|nr:internal virion protein [Rhizobium phage RHEph02]YP_009793231.1 internal virion protein [Rhizobium phage RHEph08]AGC35614.1 putative internal virion protein [Rhizobium phage RHEph02]AGC35674.1 putative internal virion protein [Rhizobium phage RHEph03]AGC35972.1 putative internal virion protein [Rhizobium phage RHEph08]